MRKLLFIVGCSLLLTMCKEEGGMESHQSKTIDLLVGTYTQKEGHVDGKASGVYKVRIDLGQAKGLILDSITGLINPSYLAVDPKAQMAVVANEIGRSYSSGWLTLVDISSDNFGQKQDTVSTRSLAPCHVIQDAKGRYAFTNYVGGVIGQVSVEDKVFGPVQYMHLPPSTKSTHPRQEDSHPHSSVVEKKADFRYIADLGTDKIWIIDESKAEDDDYEPNYFLMPYGSGPRHMAFDPTERYLYVINELSNTIACLKRDPNNGSLTMVGDLVESCSKDSSLTNYSADIHVSTDGRYLYTSNRGHNTIGIFELSPIPKALKFVSSQGLTPRNFMISKDGQFLLVANQDSGDIAVFEVLDTGLLNFKFKIDVPTPVCLVELEG